MNNIVKATWTGQYPCLCHGEWQLEVNGTDVSALIPEELRKSPMDTYGTYSCWSFDDNYIEQWGKYRDGLKGPEWISKNFDWLEKITNDRKVMGKIFSTFQKEDWRHGSCGGCI